ncbi:Intradiol ring-cleavage dioxygenase [Aspergillus floccosus]
MVQFASALIIGLFSPSSIVWAHPGHDVEAEAAKRAAFLSSLPVESRSLTACSPKLKARGIENINVVRRGSTVQQLRRDMGLDTGSRYLKARDINSVLATDHHSSLTNVGPSTDPKVLFRSQGASIAQPEVTQGPYYISGELVRRNVVEDQQGVPLFMDIQLIDTNTCNPLPNVYTDIWHCNATGVYSGVVAKGNGNVKDENNANTTFLRGVQPSDENGVVHFQTIFPGHYFHRAIHIHLATHPVHETTVLPNGTIAGMYDSRSSHVGQIFFDQDLISEVEKIAPYSSNTQPLTPNVRDRILAAEADSTDPLMEYVLLGDKIRDGIFAWMTIGIDGKRDGLLTPHSYWTEEGGKLNNRFRYHGD